MRPVRTSAVLTALLLAPIALLPQKVPKRPKMDVSSDTNSAQAYYDLGLLRLQGGASQAKDAFYWSARLDPRNGSAYIARRIAWFCEDPERFFRFAANPRWFSKDAEAQEMDSLVMKGMLRDPFSPPRLYPLLMRMIRREAFSAGVNMMPNRMDPSEVAWYALLDGDYPTAAQNYAKVVKKYPKSPYPHVQRANAMYYLGQYDSTAAELAEAVKLMSDQEEKKIVIVYESKAMFEYLAGFALLSGSDMAGAKAAFQRAVAEDMSFYMAHARLAAIADEEKDTTTALSEYETAVQLRGDDPILRFDYARMLIAVGRYDDAKVELTKSEEAEPLYAATHLLRAILAETDGDSVAAREHYGRYVTLAPRADPSLAKVRARLAELGGSK
ncbi:MAG TPA: tetratricopeptide repeat protein [Gemmatimonadaceae bacterium]|nr:tetratricopeptide repeat protein [Gemmatimonadaceae bacterium]